MQYTGEMDKRKIQEGARPQVVSTQDVTGEMKEDIKTTHPIEISNSQYSQYDTDTHDVPKPRRCSKTGEIVTPVRVIVYGSQKALDHEKKRVE